MSDDCCVDCFLDGDLRAVIDDRGEMGDCGFCGGISVKCIAPYDLNELFQPLLELYEIVEIGVNRAKDEDPSSVGDPLAYRIDAEWEIFSGKVSEPNDLLNEVLNAHHHAEDEIDVWDCWTERSNAFTARSLDYLWRGFADSLRHERRYIPKEPEPGESADPRYLLEDALPKIESIVEAGTQLYRARLGAENNSPPTPYPTSKMGAPGSHLARSGRMNPPGIAYLYLALSEKTALSEVRPWKGAYVSIARFELPKDLKVADLTNVPTKTPFGGGDLGKELDQEQLLRFLGRQFGAPVDPNAVDVAYVPTQYITELFLDFGYGAIQYPSALGFEPNLVIFDDDGLVPEEVWIREVTEVNYDFDEPNPRNELDDYLGPGV